MIQQFKLICGAEELLLTVNPDGWAENGQSWERHREYHGVFQSYTVDSFRFSTKSGGGGDFIYEKYLIDDIKTVMTVEVYDRNPQTDDFDLSYTGLLNFDPDKFKYTPGDKFVEIGFVQNADYQNFITNDEKELNINSLVGLDGTAINDFVSSPKDILFKGINLYLNVIESGLFNNNMIVFCDYDGMGYWGPVVIYLDETYIYYYADNITVNEIGDRLQTESGPTDRTAEIYTNETDFDTELIFNDVTAQSNGSILEYFVYSGGYFHLYMYLKLEIYDSEDILVSQLFVDQQEFEFVEMPPIGPGWDYLNFDLSSLIINSPITVPSGGKAILRTILTPIPGTWSTAVVRYQQNLTNNLSFIEKSPTIGDTSISGYFTHELFTRVFQQILSKENGFYSELFGRTDSEFISYLANGLGSLDFVTTGWNLRQFQNRQFIIELKKLFKTFDGVYNLMLGYDKVNERFYIEEKAQAYNSELYLLDIGEVSELTITPFKEAYFNEIKAGYEEKGDYEDFQGIFEPNLGQDYSLVMPIKETLNIKAPYNYDSIGMELTRRKPYLSYASEDTKGDEKIYVVRTDGTETIQGAEDLSGFLGIEERYNICFTPRENAIRWASFIKSGLWKEGTITLKFQSATKSVDITYKNQNGDVVNEFDNITDADLLDTRLFNPQYYEFKGVFNLNFKAVLDINPHGLIKFTFNQVPYVGFVDKIQTQDYNRQADYKLIAYETIEGENKIFMDDDPALFMDDDQHTLL